MIDTVPEALELSLKDVRIAIGKAFHGRAGMSRNAAGVLRVWLRPKAFRSRPNACPAQFAAAVLRQVSGRSIAAADEISDEAGLGNGLPSLVPLADFSHRFEVRSYPNVEIQVHEANSQEEALRMAHEAIGSVLAARRVRETTASAVDVEMKEAAGMSPAA